MSICYTSQNRVQYNQRLWCLGASLVASAVFAVRPLQAAQASNASAVGAKLENTAQTETPRRAIAPQPTPRAVEVVVVWGFRIRPTIHDSRIASLRSGYGELVRRDDCIVSICGFVMVREGTTWRATNVLAATEAELLEKYRDMEREETALVIVHPTGTRRQVPAF
jgi:hypothetical protein